MAALTAFRKATKVFAAFRFVVAFVRRAEEALVVAEPRLYLYIEVHDGSLLYPSSLRFAAVTRQTAAWSSFEHTPGQWANVDLGQDGRLDLFASAGAVSLMGLFLMDLHVPVSL
jgi:hypothetical protein